MAESSTKDRVYAAAEQIAVDRNPTVATVREAAGVSNGDATRYLKEWREERASAGSTIAALPQVLAEHALRLAGGMWAEASTAATTTHAVLEAAWREEKTRQEKDIEELVRDLDAANQAATEAGLRHEAELRAAVTEADSQKNAADTARQELATAVAAHTEKNGALQLQLAEAGAKVSTLQSTLTALMARIPNTSAE